MAEGTSVRQEDVVCRYFLTSSCRDGDRCLFSHDISRRIPDSVCRYYLQGKCVYGQNCRYDHVRVNKESNSKSNTHNDRHSAGPSRHSANREVICNLTRSDSNKKNSRFNTLSRRNEISNTNAPSSASSNWIDAPEFVPKHTRSYADTVKANTVCTEPEKMPSTELCQYYMVGECPFDRQCPYIHGDMCELCQRAILNPYDEKQRKVHIEECEKVLEQDMELSFAIQRSMDKTCGICMDVVLEKEPLSERRFGILEKCNHVYCLSCIRKWRRSKQYESNQHIDNALDPVVTRACPECRIPSDFVTPSGYFVDTEDEKKKLITEYKKALSQKDCKYFKKGEGTCPFGGACFYLHAKPDGTKVDLPLPTRRRRQNQDGLKCSVRNSFVKPLLAKNKLSKADVNRLLWQPKKVNKNCIAKQISFTATIPNLISGRNVSLSKQARFVRPALSVFYRFQSSDSAAYTASYDFETLTVTAPDDHILHVQLNRPENYNAMNKMFWREFLDCFRKIRDDRSCRAVILSGSGQLFSAGLDYSDMQDITSQVAGKGDVARKAKFLLSLIAKYQESFNAVENCQKPVIAAIHGKCSGGGVDLICACDVRYCSEDTFFQIEEVDVGMAADMGTLQRLPKIVGNDSLVREYAFSCAKIDPKEAKTIGLVGRIFPDQATMMTAALNLARVIASKSPVAIQGTKVGLNFSRDHSVADGLQFMTYWNMTMLQSEDVLKAAEATINKSDKPPKYSKL